MNLINNDVLCNKEILSKNDIQLNRRNFLRSLISSYEFDLANLRDITIRLIIMKFDETGYWDILQLIPLLDYFPAINETGKLKEGFPNRYTLLSLVSYSVKSLSTIINYPKNPFADCRWNDFRKTIQIRNRISHPKIGSDIDISDNELVSIEKGWQWWNELIKDLIIAKNEFYNSPLE